MVLWLRHLRIPVRRYEEGLVEVEGLRGVGLGPRGTMDLMVMEVSGCEVGDVGVFRVSLGGGEETMGCHMENGGEVREYLKDLDMVVEVVVEVEDMEEEGDVAGVGDDGNLFEIDGKQDAYLQ